MARKKGYPRDYCQSLNKEGKKDLYNKLINFFESVITKFPNKWNFGQLSRFQIELEKVEGGN